MRGLSVIVLSALSAAIVIAAPPGVPSTSKAEDVGMSTERLAGGTGAPEKIFANPNFSFENQANFPISASVAQGDVMRTRCTWKNPGDTAISFGENTGDEMCFDFIGMQRLFLSRARNDPAELIKALRQRPDAPEEGQWMSSPERHPLSPLDNRIWATSAR